RVPVLGGGRVLSPAWMLLAVRRARAEEVGAEDGAPRLDGLIDIDFAGQVGSDDRQERTEERHPKLAGLQTTGHGVGPPQ
ncbi:MAG: hypothetical protein MK196_12050, partial [Acidimicrobiales bacterium]|nr:hypothetical protein [Acidimicrobiales bacterium]